MFGVEISVKSWVAADSPALGPSAQYGNLRTCVAQVARQNQLDEGVRSCLITSLYVAAEKIRLADDADG